MSNLIGRIHSFETFALVDGPGIRCAVFLHGCALRCKYCHNPDTWRPCDRLIHMTPAELRQKLVRYRNYWKKHGGVTISGGEPLLQLDFVTETFRLLKKDGVHTAIDTAGQPFAPRDEAWMHRFDALLDVTDLVILDLKQFDSALHRELTGYGNENILAMAQYVSARGKDLWIRHVLVPGITDDPVDLTNMSTFIASLPTVRRVEVLPYHTLGVSKWQQLGLEYPLEGIPTPTTEQIQRAEEILHVTQYHE